MKLGKKRQCTTIQLVKRIQKWRSRWRNAWREIIVRPKCHWLEVVSSATLSLTHSLTRETMQNQWCAFLRLQSHLSLPVVLRCWQYREGSGRHCPPRHQRCKSTRACNHCWLRHHHHHHAVPYLSSHLYYLITTQPYHQQASSYFCSIDSIITTSPNPVIRASSLFFLLPSVSPLLVSHISHAIKSNIVTSSIFSVLLFFLLPVVSPVLRRHFSPLLRLIATSRLTCITSATSHPLLCASSPASLSPALRSAVLT